MKDNMKIFRWVWSKMLLANHITEFLNQLYLKKEIMNQFEFLYADIDLRMAKDDQKFIALAESEILLINQIS